MAMAAEHICPHEKDFQSYGNKIAELEAYDSSDAVNSFTIDGNPMWLKMDSKMDRIDDKIDTIMMKSIQGDNDINQRVTSLETTVKVLKWVMGFIGISGLVWAIKTFMG